MHFLNVLRIAKKPKILFSDPVIIYYVLYNNFFYTQLDFVFDRKKDFYFIHDNINIFSFFINVSPASYWSISLFFFYNIPLAFFRYTKTTYKKMFHWFFICFKKLTLPYELSASQHATSPRRQLKVLFWLKRPGL